MQDVVAANGHLFVVLMPRSICRLSALHVPCRDDGVSATTAGAPSNRAIEAARKSMGLSDYQMHQPRAEHALDLHAGFRFLHGPKQLFCPPANVFRPSAE